MSYHPHLRERRRQNLDRHGGPGVFHLLSRGRHARTEQPSVRRRDRHGRRPGLERLRERPERHGRGVRQRGETAAGGLCEGAERTCALRGQIALLQQRRTVGVFRNRRTCENGLVGGERRGLDDAPGDVGPCAAAAFARRADGRFGRRTVRLLYGFGRDRPRDGHDRPPRELHPYGQCAFPRPRGRNLGRHAVQRHYLPSPPAQTDRTYAVEDRGAGQDARHLFRKLIC